MNGSNSADGLMAVLIVLALCPPSIFVIGFGVGLNSVSQEYNQLMANELAKGCIKQPTNCKIYQDYYNAFQKHQTR